MSRATDLRYGRRGGGWIPEVRRLEHRRPHLLKDAPCPAPWCRGLIRNQPRAKQTEPYEIGPCNSCGQIFDVTPLAPHQEMAT